MKRLVICCDGTWNQPDNLNVSNVEKIARTVQTDLAQTGDVQQLVLYLRGVGGGGYFADRLLGGAFGFGLFSNVRDAYRFLALNYEPGDEIFVFGFSRGAYTARSLVGMIGKVGLLTRRAMVADKFPEAVARYRRRAPAGGRPGQSAEEFRRDYCHEDPAIQFLGVFDTVGALGVPGALRRRHQFHDVCLSDKVRCARQALAVDERRLKFEPCLWEVPENGVAEDPRVRQVWFEGVHSDIGGGYAQTGLSDTALLWMVSEANRRGLAFDEALLEEYVDSGSSAIRHSSMTPFYWLTNLVMRAKIALGVHPGKAFRGGRRRLDRDDCLSVRVAEPTAEHYLSDRERVARSGEPLTANDYAPDNLRTWAQVSDDFHDCTEPVVGLPELSYDRVREVLAQRGVHLGLSRPAPPDAQSMPAARNPATVSDRVW